MKRKILQLEITPHGTNLPSFPYSMLRTVQGIMGRKTNYGMAPKGFTTQQRFTLNKVVYKKPYNKGKNHQSYPRYTPKKITNVSEFPLYEPKVQEPVSESLQLLKDHISQGKPLSIQDYFQSTHFAFAEEKQESSLRFLKNNIELINSGRPLIAMDCEAYEREHLSVTEIGIAVMENNGERIPDIKTYHVVVLEHIDKRNSRYVPDKKDNFMGGTSLVMTKQKSREFLQGILEKYIEGKDGILICHQVSSELKYFRSIGLTHRQDIKTLDTMSLQQISRLGGNSLWATLRLLGIPYAHLHNAGNDAYFTLLAALALCDPVTRIKKNLDIYSESQYKGKKGSHKDEAEYVVVEDVQLLMKSL